MKLQSETESELLEIKKKEIKVKENKELEKIYMVRFKNLELMYWKSYIYCSVVLPICDLIC